MVGKAYKKVAIGILALQGDVELHAKKLRLFGIEPQLVKLPQQLKGLQGLIIPGGESTALLKLAEATDILPAIKHFAKTGGNIFGTCAGAIILARVVTYPSQKSLGLIDVTIKRNAYGRQIDSFEASGQTHSPLKEGSLPMIFIRAPRIAAVGKKTETLATYQNEPVLVSDGNILVATFHPELTNDNRVYEYWLKKIN